MELRQILSSSCTAWQRKEIWFFFVSYGGEGMGEEAMGV
jgi:hypothetical protein